MFCLSNNLSIVYIRCLDSTLTIITYLSSNLNIFKETTPSNSRLIKQNYSSCSDHLAVAKIFSEWNHTQNNYTCESSGEHTNPSISKNSLTMMYSEYYFMLSNSFILIKIYPIGLNDYTYCITIKLF